MNTQVHNSEPEVWKPTVGQPGYEVSSYGRIRSFKGAVRGRILNPRLDDGYRRLVLMQQGKRKDFHVHVLVALAFLGDPPAPKYNIYLRKYIPYVVNHKDGNRQNNHLWNLKWVTPSEDKLHSYHVLGNTVGGWGKGSRHSTAKLTESDVLDIRHDIKYKKATQLELALKLDVTRRTINQIVNRQTWSWLKEEEKNA